jgi:hypothetical protein
VLKPWAADALKQGLVHRPSAPTVPSNREEHEAVTTRIQTFINEIDANEQQIVALSAELRRGH